MGWKINKKIICQNCCEGELLINVCGGVAKCNVCGSCFKLTVEINEITEQEYIHENRYCRDTL